MARGGSLLAVMHTEITDTGSSIEVAKRDWKGPLAAYPESGYFTMPNWQFVDVIAPEDFAAHAADASACWKIPTGIAVPCPQRAPRVSAGWRPHRDGRVRAPAPRWRAPAGRAARRVSSPRPPCSGGRGGRGSRPAPGAPAPAPAP